MATHDLRCWPEPFQHVVDGIKRHEVRVADRTYQTNDVVGLHEWEPTTECYTGRVRWFRIGVVTRGGDWGLPKELCVFTLTDMDAPCRFPSCTPTPALVLAAFKFDHDRSRANGAFRAMAELGLAVAMGMLGRLAPRDHGHGCNDLTLRRKTGYDAEGYSVYACDCGADEHNAAVHALVGEL